MAFNLKKNAQKKGNSVLPTETGLQEFNDKLNASLKQNDTVPHYDALLEKDRRPYNGTVVTHEAMLDAARKKFDSPEKIVEGALDDSDSNLFPHRQFMNGEDKYQVSPINAMTHAFDKKYRDAFSKANKGADTSFWDKYVGDQLDGKMTKVPANLPQEGSQLHDNPERFGKLKNLPINPSAIINRKNFDSGIDVDPMHGFMSGEKGITIAENVRTAMASIKDADGLLFGIYLKSAQENRELNDIEQEIVDGINRDKQNLIISLAQSSSFIPPPESKKDQPSGFEETGADFMDNGPTDPNVVPAGDSAMWGQQSGFDEQEYSAKNDFMEQGGDPSLESSNGLDESSDLGGLGDSLGGEVDSLGETSVPLGEISNEIEDPSLSDFDFNLNDRIPTPKQRDENLGIGEFAGSDSSEDPILNSDSVLDEGSPEDLGGSVEGSPLEDGSLGNSKTKPYFDLGEESSNESPSF